MKVANATNFILVLWLIVASRYWITSHCVLPHTLWKGYSSCWYERNEHKPQTNLVLPCFNVSLYCNILYILKTHRMKQSCECIFIDRYYTNCIALTNLYHPSINYSISHNINASSRHNNHMVNTCVYNHACFKTLGDVRNVRNLINHNIYTNIYNQFVNTNMHAKSYYHKMNVCNIHMILPKHVSHSNLFFFYSQFLGGPQLNLWKGIRGKMIRSKAHSKLKYKPIFCFACNRMATSTPTLSSRKLFENENVDSINGKRPVLAVVLSSQKKVKGIKPSEIGRAPYWFGFHAMNSIAKAANMPLIQTPSFTELVKNGVSEFEAHEMVESCPSFPFVDQKEWPSKRIDGKKGMHFNLTQIPLDVEVGDHGFALDYHISIHFELEGRELDRDMIIDLTKDRLKSMKIEVGEILGEPIAILCFHGTKRWSGVIKLHLKNPEMDGYGLLRGLRPFILKIGPFKLARGKVCKSFDTIAIASMLSVKITTPSIKGKEWYDLFEEIVGDGFRRGLDFEITNVQKLADAEFAWIKAPSPDEAKRFKAHKLSFFNEMVDVNFASNEKLSDDDKARKNALILIARNLNKVKTTMQIEDAIRKCMGERNVLGFYFRLENGKHTGSCNVQCLNSFVYKKFVKKNEKILGKYAEFTPHPKSLDGINAPSKEELVRLGFSDVNTALANTIQALENGPHHNVSNKDLNKMVEAAVKKGTDEIRKEMVSLKGEIVQEAKVYADHVQAESNKNSKLQIQLLQRQMRITLDAIEAAHPDKSELENNMDLTN